MRQMVVLVDRRDRKIGLEEKMRAHKNGGKLHRSISVMVFNSKGQIMLQRRSDSKYHSPGLWSNTCCSHPIEGESAIDAAHRRLKQEMGFDCELNEAFTFIYKVYVGKGLTESEFDHVVFGIYDRKPKPNQKEVKDWRWASLKWLKSDIKKNRDSYTQWFNIIMTDRPITSKLMHSMKKFLSGKLVSTSL